MVQSVARDSLVEKASLEKEIAYLKERLATIDDRWKGAVVKCIWAGSTYNHARYFRGLERQSLYAKLKRQEQKLRKILRDERRLAEQDDRPQV